MNTLVTSSDLVHSTCEYVPAQNIEDDLRMLAPYSGTDVDSLPMDVKERLENVIEYMRTPHDDPTTHTMNMVAITKHFSNRDGTYNAGTLGAFLIGCYATDPVPDIPVGCSPTCLATMTEGNADGLVQCENGVMYMAADGSITLLNNKFTSIMYLYVVKDIDLKKHMDKIHDLKSNNVQQVIVYQYQNGAFTKIDTVVVNGGTNGIVVYRSCTPLLCFLLLLLLIVIVGGVIYYLSKKRGQQY